MFSKIPLTAFRTFEAAARSGSFKAAADELFVTPAAVSYQVKALEAWVGALLFERTGKGVQLTPEGERLYRDAHRALLDIRDSLAGFRPQPDLHTLVLSTTPALASAWLIPRLGDFYRAWPHINVRVETSNDLVDLLRDSSIDLAIRTSSRDDPGLISQPLMDERFGAYVAPGFTDPAQQTRVELINLRWQIPGGFKVDWSTWCAAAGHTDWLPQAVMREYDDEHFALNAAIAGHGLVLASNVLVMDSLAKGLLVPYRPDISLPGPSYMAVCAPGRERQSPVSEFLGWLKSQLTLTN
ncbi:LysR substrate-binding domain-containing protein [Pseudomonas sp. DSP3-2-2]|uniref:LysR substrate-binding domain-containing protein n=1 Tax=unclassified Pseudomonas TaxID=196821 RepID=UPI003CFB1E7B